MTLFVDSSAFYGMMDRGDGVHERAKAALRSGDRFLTTDHILVETWTLLHVRLGWAVADRFWAGIRSGVADVEHVGPADLEHAWAIGKAFADQSFSIVDRTSFAVMERLGIHRVVSFDSDFAIYRFGSRKERAFEVVG